MFHLQHSLGAQREYRRRSGQRNPYAEFGECHRADAGTDWQPGILDLDQIEENARIEQPDRVPPR
ncbi:hypothetical protein GCM10023318_54860 [Nocardia callitridis]|uniref:Uncharacterized protein n=1 Tax=Nocardia callitridis TaxID=648753 RepID=A0ABP9KV87_9NOCA